MSLMRAYAYLNAPLDVLSPLCSVIQFGEVFLMSQNTNKFARWPRAGAETCRQLKIITSSKLSCVLTN